MTVCLNGSWKLGEFDEGTGEAAGAHLPSFDDSAWIPALVPGDVHTALRQAGRIEDPYAARNIEACQWVEEREWWYRTTFEAQAPAEGERADLVFEGLDTFATIYLNGEVLGSTENMLVPHRLDATAALKAGTNTLAVRFAPTVPIVERLDASPFWSAFHAHRVWVRKAAMNFGWDWGPRLVTCGVWRSTRLEAVAGLRIESHYARTYALAPQHAVVTVGATVERLRAMAGTPLLLRATLTHAGESITGSSVFSGDTAEVRLLVPAPELWWPAGMGTQPLHPLRLEVCTLDGAVVATLQDRVGIRTVGLLQEPDPDGLGKTFIVTVNGRKVFAKGANWIPADNFIGAVPAERYRALVALAAEGNMNILRVWGGGVYEDDAFYAACDDLGVLVWQDFMFSCASYPDFDPDFLANVRDEAEKVVKRLRNHPCIALWNGNNENDWIDDMQGRGDPPMPFYGRRIYHEVLPSIVGAFDPSRPYWPSSPYGGSDHGSEREGDRHNWQIWGGQVIPHHFGVPYAGEATPENVSFRNYAKDMCRFCSEYGIHASPPLRTLTRRTGELEYDSEAFLYRIKDPDSSRKQRMMLAHSGLPSGLEQYRCFSMLVQAEGLRFAIEHYRRRAFDCAGSIIWQHNDCWPGISWSLLDYDLNPKAGWYYARRAYAPVALSLQIENGSAALFVANGTLADVPVEVTVLTVDTLEGVQHERTVLGTAAANASGRLVSYSLAELGVTDPTRQFLVLREATGKAPEHAVFLAEMKDVRFRAAQLSIEFVPGPGGGTVTLRSDVVAHFVGVEVDSDRATLCDNYVTLLPGESRTLTVHACEPVSREMLSVDCLNDHVSTVGS